MSLRLFTLLSYDVITYVLTTGNIRVDLPYHSDLLSNTKRIFRKELGEVVCEFMTRGRRKFAQLFEEYSGIHFEDDDSIEYYADFAIEKVLKRESFLMDVVRILAFYTDLIIICYMTGHTKFIHSALVSLVDTYQKNFMKPMTVIGIDSLFRFSDQLIEFQDFKLVDDKLTKTLQMQTDCAEQASSADGPFAVESDLKIYRGNNSRDRRISCTITSSSEIDTRLMKESATENNPTEDIDSMECCNVGHCTDLVDSGNDSPDESLFLSTDSEIHKATKLPVAANTITNSTVSNNDAKFPVGNKIEKCFSNDNSQMDIS